jgi:hypothetical protein
VKIIRLKGKIQKVEGQRAEILQKVKFNRDLDRLEPGSYEILIRPINSKIELMKKAYFCMESELSRYLGYKKVKLHNQLKEFIGHEIDLQTGTPKYQSVTEIDNEEEMMIRIEELHSFSAKQFNYTFPPYNPD